MTTATPRPVFRRTVAAAAALTVLVLAGACSSGGSDDAADGGGSGGSGDGESGGSSSTVASAPRETADRDGVAADLAVAPVAESEAQQNAAGAPAEEASAGQEPKLVSNGNVQLKSDDVGQALFDVRKVVDTYSGEVEANSTETDDKGAPLRARLQIRVPTAQFDETMQDLERVGVLIASSGDTKDVTTEVLDRDIRVQVQRRSIERISILLEQAVTIRDVVAIEAQLSQRQADLAVLEKEQRYLDDQTAMATINVSVERTKDKKEPTTAAKKKDDSGFMAGLTAGWGGLKTFGVGLATVLGALLPWMVVLAVLAIPGLPLLRRFRRRDPATPATT